MKPIQLLFLKHIPLFISILAVLSCGSGDNEGENGTTPISDEWQAESIAGMINTACSQVGSKLPGVYQSSYTYTLTNQAYTSSNGGTCLVNGTTTRSYSSSSSSVNDRLTINITIKFTDWNTDSGSYIRKISGTVTYYCYTSSTQSGLSYFSSLSKSISGNGLNVFDDSEKVEDTISINVSDYDDNDYMVTGTITGTKGTFSF